MRLETDISTIERLAREREDANWQFRCFLKNCDLAEKEIDAIVHDLYRAVSERIDCLECANCCRVIQPLLKQEDIRRLASALGVPRGDFVRQYLTKGKEGESYVFKAMPCPFLSGNSCSVYAHGPDDCRSYPHLHKSEFVFRLNQAVSNCSVCPISYNVFELLKQAIRDRGVSSFFCDQK
jgi:Fe-S-cluster containining protein